MSSDLHSFNPDDSSAYLTRTGSVSPRMLFSATLLLASCLAPEGVLAMQDQWFLMAAHSGECAPLKVLQRKFPDLPDVRTPDQFIAFIKTKGQTPTVSTLQSNRGRAVLVEMPEEQLSLTFVTEKVCTSPDQ